MARQTIGEVFDLSGKGAIVTGAGRGIGRAIAVRLAEAGAGVVVADIGMEGAEETVRRIETRGGRARAIHADAGKVPDAARVARAAVDAFGRLDILVNNAGVFPLVPALEITEEMWDRVLDINLKGVFFYSQAAAREMVEAGHGGKIINMASMEGVHPRADMASYVTAKAGVIMVSKVLALELAPHNILVNAVAPGGIGTPGIAEQGSVLQAMGRCPVESTQAFVSRLPLGRMGEPDDVAKVVLFLASSASDYMTGSVVLVDGGFLLS